MAWELIGRPEASPEWAKWVDRSAVSRALRTLAYQVARPLPDDGGPDPELAWRKTAELFQTIRAFCLACDLPPTSLGYYAGERLRLDDGSEDLTGLYVTPNTQRLETFRVLQRHSAAFRDARDNGQNADVQLYLRVDFDRTESVGVRRGLPPDPPHGRDRYLDDHTDRPGAVTDWATTVWSEYTRAGASRDLEVIAFAPLRVSYELAMTVARLIVENGAVAAATRSFAFIIVRNMRVARLLAGPGAPDEDVLRAAAAVEVQGITAPTLPPTAAAGLAAFRAAKAIARDIPGGEVAELVVTVLLGIVEWPYLLGGTAVGRRVDAWGRLEPVLYKPDYAGSLLPSPGGTPPPDPPPAPPFDVVDQALPESGFETYQLYGEPTEGDQLAVSEDAGGGLGIMGLVAGAGALWLWSDRKKRRR